MLMGLYRGRIMHGAQNVNTKTVRSIMMGAHYATRDGCAPLGRLVLYLQQASGEVERLRSD